MTKYVKKKQSKKPEKPEIMPPIQVFDVDEEDRGEAKEDQHETEEETETAAPEGETTHPSGKQEEQTTKPPTFDESHIRKTIYFTNDNWRKLQEEKTKNRRSATRIVNQALENYFG
ncbi:hypothetical protein [Salibacterium qingdaonense]|uniref:Uncharacterized protein n=1 Tax=Salibacterium qingdaonense TaxID=266892 RepID=A0A1I4NYJ9_9BACI|nr:hypothetical protein [Salibacterium qingdaonense]SFM20380.1 hypothetical protein SAMN04488054_12141 [Salibacterium qingdaonense]